jgi:hypothetical protein
MTSGLRVGVDFDNTIITYDEVFRATTKSCGLLDADFAGSKQALRDAIRLLPDGELIWQRLQAQVYGRGIVDARMVAGFEAFLRRCRAEGCGVVIVSHKTRHGAIDPERIDLRQAALDWMAAHDLFDGEHGIELKNVYFENTRAEKLKRIASLGLTHFVDDLVEVLSDPQFPPHVRRILFTDDARQTTVPYAVCPTWHEIQEQVFERA